MREVLAVALLTIAFLVGLWDVWMIARGTPEETVSVVLLDWSLHFPILPLIVGVVIGHVFFPNTSVTIIKGIDRAPKAVPVRQPD